jgi:hypothetical protein
MNVGNMLIRPLPLTAFESNMADEARLLSYGKYRKQGSLTNPMKATKLEAQGSSTVTHGTMGVVYWHSNLAIRLLTA